MQCACSVSDQFTFIARTDFMPLRFGSLLFQGIASSNGRDEFVIAEDYDQEECKKHQFMFEVVRMEECSVTMVNNIHQFVAEADR